MRSLHHTSRFWRTHKYKLQCTQVAVTQAKIFPRVDKAFQLPEVLQLVWLNSAGPIDQDTTPIQFFLSVFAWRFCEVSTVEWMIKAYHPVAQFAMRELGKARSQLPGRLRLSSASW
jgi:hypothetical protein